jgi:membrane protease YdiL (CAAX protease family)
MLFLVTSAAFRLVCAMLSVKSWKLDALIRLFVSVLICSLFLGAISMSLFRFFTSQPSPHAPALLGSIAATFAMLLVALFILRRSWPLDRLVRNLVILLISVYGGILLMYLTGRIQGSPTGAPNPTAQVILSIASFQGAVLLLVHFFLREHGVGWREGFGFDHRPLRSIALGLLAGIGAVPICWALQTAVGLMLQWFDITLPEQEAVHLLRSSHGILPRAIMGAAAIIVAPIAEEILFRGLLYPAIKHAGYPRAALWISALLFAAIHLNLATFLPLAALAIGLIWLYEKTDNLLAPIAAHSLFNAANFAMLFALDSFPQTLNR